MDKIPNDIIESVKRFKNIAAAVINIEKVFIYGSYAKGSGRAGSDIDVCIIANEKKNPYLIMRDINRKTIETDVRIEPVVFLSDDYHDNEPRGLLREIIEHGVEI
jgi:predicted nucleotidyltransferase